MTTLTLAIQQRDKKFRKEIKKILSNVLAKQENSNKTKRLPKISLTNIRQKRVETKISEALMNFLKALYMRRNTLNSMAHCKTFF